MGRKRKTRANDFTQRFRAGEYDADSVDKIERLDGREKALTQRKITQTAELRAEGDAKDNEALPLGVVRQVFSLYFEVRPLPVTELPTDQSIPQLVPAASSPPTVLCTIRKTLNKRRETTAVVGDIVRYREEADLNDVKQPKGVIERVEPRKTLLTRSDSFKALTQAPIVANATHMMIVVSVAMPRPKWGLVDRMLIAAKAGGLSPILCLNKIDLGDEHPHLLTDAREVLAHYRTLGIDAHETCATDQRSANILKDLLRNRITVLAGHSGVGKSSLVRLVEPSLDIRVASVSEVNEKGRHTTTSARIYDLPTLSAEIIDTPGVKLFGLWNLTAEDLDDLYPDITAGTAPQWRVESHQRIAESLGSLGR